MTSSGRTSHKGCVPPPSLALIQFPFPHPIGFPSRHVPRAPCSFRGLVLEVLGVYIQYPIGLHRNGVLRHDLACSTAFSVHNSTPGTMRPFGAACRSLSDLSPNTVHAAETSGTSACSPHTSCHAALGEGQLVATRSAQGLSCGAGRATHAAAPV